jgi:hypothetical protein
MFRDNYMGPFLPNHTLAEPEIFRTRTALRQGKNVASEGGGLIGLCFRGTMSQSSNAKHLNLGEDNDDHTHDTSRSSDNIKSFDSPDGTQNVRHRW